MRLRPPDWLLYPAVVTTLLGVVIFSYSGPDSPPPPTPAKAEPQDAALGPASPFDPVIIIKTPVTAGPGAGTAFSVGKGGLWLTARHVVDDCAKLAIVVAPGRAVAAVPHVLGRGETAVLTTQGGTPPLGFAPIQPLRQGATAYHIGYPGNAPGEAMSRLVRRETLLEHGRHGVGVESVLTWAEVARTPGLEADLAGISGAPALDPSGRVVGVTIAQAARRGRIYTTRPQALRAALAIVGRPIPTVTLPTQPLTAATYGQIASDLRQTLRVVQLVCLAN